LISLLNLNSGNADGLMREQALILSSVSGVSSGNASLSSSEPNKLIVKLLMD